MTSPAAYQVVFTPAARRGMNRLPPVAAQAMFEHLTGPVAENPHRLGKQLDAPLDGPRSTRRGEYRALYGVHDNKLIVTVVVVAHRRDAYRSR
ncbi:type II toxin-antitoxin system RelE/ParE family toxin [Pseudonocardia nematodicida]|uniref:Type II toxin-antitoxin system RelE/ParE family toxin n=1 Tax=Pseudonocardia nematodicida TaxID=1206997 RepID=A0ABV1KBY0_9PSEU